MLVDPTKFFGCELGAQTTFDFKRDRYIVNGSHEAEKLQDLLDGFIKKFVLCPECENPETVFSVHAKAQTISQACRACGYSGQCLFMVITNFMCTYLILRVALLVCDFCNNSTWHGGIITENFGRLKFLEYDFSHRFDIRRYFHHPSWLCIFI